MLQIRSDALAAAAELSLSTAPHCRHVIVSDSESDREEYQSCKSDSMEDSEIELDLQSDDDIELDPGLAILRSGITRERAFG